MNLDKKGTLKLIAIIFASILFFACVTHFGMVLSVLGKIVSVMMPIYVGLGLAFIFNIPLKFLELKVFKKLTYSRNKLWKKIKRPICLTLSLLLVISFVTIVLVIIIPQLIKAFESLFRSLPDYMNTLDALLDKFVNKFHIPTGNVEFDINWEVVSSKLLALISSNEDSIANTTIDIAMKFGSGVFNFVFGFIFSVYILASKESLGRMGRRFIFSVFSSDRAKGILKITSMSNKAFSGFISGQFLEALTIGILCFIGMIILKMEYPLLVSVIISIFAIIPIFGAIIGTVIGAFIILLVNPMQALWFVVFIIILQQIESNVIYPKIMGKSVGLPGIWVLVAVTVFGGLWGVFGIVISIPICSVAYALFDNWMSKRLIERNISHKYYEVDHSRVVYHYGMFKLSKKKKEEGEKNANEKQDDAVDSSTKDEDEK